MSAQKTVRRDADSVHENPVRLEAEQAEQIVAALNADLADAYVLYHQLHKHHWNVEDAGHLDVHRFLQEANEAVELAADAVVERIQALGGVPHASMTAIAEAATVGPEDEDVYDVRTSLASDLEEHAHVIDHPFEDDTLVFEGATG